MHHYEQQKYNGNSQLLIKTKISLFSKLSGLSLSSGRVIWHLTPTLVPMLPKLNPSEEETKILWYSYDIPKI